jgi:hypothetical protein
MKNFKGLGRQGDNLFIAAEQALSGIENKRAEKIDRFRGLAHVAIMAYLIKIEEILCVP